MTIIEDSVRRSDMPSVEGREYSIREVARMFGVEPSTLRYYEDSGLLTNVERTASGQRVYLQCHINRLASISCFKDAGMTISDLKRFFALEAAEGEHSDEIVDLLEGRRAAIQRQRAALDEAYAHVLRKLHFYTAIRTSVHEHKPAPSWDDYRDTVFTS